MAHGLQHCSGPSSPQVSVLTTVYNGIQYLPQTVESVFGQTFSEFQYVVVDDGSTDGTGSYLKRIEDPRLTLVTLPRSGRGVALNTGLSVCTADLIAILDADDVASPSRLEIQTRAFATHDDLCVIDSRCCFGIAELQGSVAATVSIDVIPTHRLVRQNPLYHSAVMMRRRDVLAVGGYDVHRRNLFDYDLWIRMAQQGLSFGRVQLPLVFKRIHKGQTFERGSRIPYLVSGFRQRQRAVSLFGEGPFDRVYPFVGFAYGLLPQAVRQRRFRQPSGEDVTIR